MRGRADDERSWVNLIIDFFYGPPKLQPWIAPADGWRQPGVINRLVDFCIVVTHMTASV
jgi:hypothetical protein